MSTSLKGLAQAVQPFTPQSDPLGINVMQRARDARFQDQLQHPNPIGPLPDPQWAGWEQAVDEAGGGKPVNFAGSAGPELGYDTNNGTMGAGTETYGARGLMWNRQSLQGLRKASGQNADSTS